MAGVQKARDQSDGDDAVKAAKPDEASAGTPEGDSGAASSKDITEPAAVESATTDVKAERVQARAERKRARAEKRRARAERRSEERERWRRAKQARREERDMSR